MTLLPPRLLRASRRLAWMAFLGGWVEVACCAGTLRPLPDHPGNVFLAGEEVSIPLDSHAPSGWQAVDYDGHVRTNGVMVEGRAWLGRLPVGYYEVRTLDSGNPSSPGIAVAVLEPLRHPVSPGSPVRLDVAMSWLVPQARWREMANLCSLAGVSWVRDRFRWSELESSKHVFASELGQDATAHIQSAAGLRVLQVHHDTPAWAGPLPTRFALDLRSVFELNRAVALRWRGQVSAFEPWNEADIDVFGGHTGSEMATFQKAAFLGLRIGNREALVCQNAFATPRQATLDDYLANRPAAYLDTFNLHHYLDPEAYAQTYAKFREVSGGRPLWVTECGQSLHWEGDETLRELSPAGLKLQSERVPKLFATAIQQGAAGVFYFLMPHYSEGQNQFGLLRSDLSPRPAYLALAATGRLLSDARALGRLEADSSVRAFLFGARPDGLDRVVLVAWSTNESASLDLPVAPEAAFDHLGRTLREISRHLPLSTAPKFVVFPRGSLHRFPHTLPPPVPDVDRSDPSSIVLQAAFPPEGTLLNTSSYRVRVDRPEIIPVFAYNFGTQPARGTLRVAGPPGWRVTLPGNLTLAPMERRELAMTVDARGRLASEALGRLRIDGRFGSSGRPSLSLRLQPDRTNTLPQQQLVIAAADDPERWRSFVSGNAAAQITRSGPWISIEASPTTDNRWLYPQFSLQPEERLTEEFNAIEVTFELLEGSGQFRVILEEENGSSYMVNFETSPKAGQPIDAVVRLDAADWGATWSLPDPNSRLDAGQVRAVRIGCNTTASHLRYRFKNLRWLRL